MKPTPLSCCVLADVSCNGADTEHYTCLCNNWIDRCIGLLDLSPCEGMACKCSNESLARSAQHVGRMPVFAPFPNLHRQTVHAGFLPDLHVAGKRTCDALPVARSTFLGYWYSFPAAAECEPAALATLLGGASASLGALDDVGGRTSCTWSRHAAQRLVRGEALLGLGFNISQVCDVPQLLQNRDVIDRAIDLHPARCCGC